MRQQQQSWAYVQHVPWLYNNYVLLQITDSQNINTVLLKDDCLHHYLGM